MTSPLYETIRVERSAKVGRIWLDRPDVHNAFNSRMVEEAPGGVAVARRGRRRPGRRLVGDRVIVLRGGGPELDAGDHPLFLRAEPGRIARARRVAPRALFPAQADRRSRERRGHGGGAGFLSACDIVIASTEARFGLSEVKIGLVPACIAPYVLRRTGEGRARPYFLTGERFDARRALEIGLVNIAVEPAELDRKVEEVVSSLLSSGPEALAKAKELLARVPGMSFDEAKRYTAEMIAGLRTSAEGQEGMAAFLEKRKPKWSE